jgi:DNA-binding transcriptional MerR regulator
MSSCGYGLTQLGANVRIGEAASETGVTVKAIPHYEAVGLLGVLERDGAYREFSADDLERLRLIAHCRDLGFGLPEIRRVLQIVADAQPSCPDPEAMIDVVDGRLRAISFGGGGLVRDANGSCSSRAS